MDTAFEKTLDPIEGSPTTGKSVAGIINLFVCGLFGTGGNEMEERVLTRLRKDFQVGSEDWNDVTFTGQRIRCTQDFIKLDRTMKLVKKRPMRNWRRSQRNETRKKISTVLLQCTQCTEAFRDKNWLQGRTQFQCCYKFSRCASMAASPTLGDVKALDKLARQLKSQQVKLQF